MSLKGLIIREPWIDEILAGRKIWELRARPFSYRGEVALIRQGSGQIEGVARMTDCLPPLDARRMRETEPFHRVPAQMVDDVIARGWRVPWVLTDVRRLPRPVPYTHPRGAVITVDLAPAVEAQIRQQMTAAPTSAVKNSANPSPGPFVGLPRAPDAPAAQAISPASTVTPAPIKRRWTRTRRGRNIIALVSALVGITSALCLVIWFGKLVTGGPVHAIFTWSGIRWLVWGCLGALVLGIVKGVRTPGRDAG